MRERVWWLELLDPFMPFSAPLVVAICLILWIFMPKKEGGDLTGDYVH